MGNCQAVDAAALVIQHPGGKIERYYWPISAKEVMKTNPDHYVSLIIPLPEKLSGTTGGSSDQAPEKSNIRYTRVKLLKPTDTLVLGHAYRLITSQEVSKVLRAKRNKKMKINETEYTTSIESDQVAKNEKGGVKVVTTNSIGSGRPRSWRPSLQSISEATS